MLISRARTGVLGRISLRFGKQPMILTPIQYQHLSMGICYDSTVERWSGYRSEEAAIDKSLLEDYCDID